MCFVAKIFEYMKKVFYALQGQFQLISMDLLKGALQTSNLLLYREFLSKTLENRQIDVVYSDFSKSFDRVQHVY